MLDLTILKRATIVGLVCQLALLTCGWLWPWFRPGLLFGVMMTAGVAGLLYARDLARGFRAGALGGGAVGASCGVVAVAASNLFGARPALFIPWGVMVLTFTGIVGGLFGQLDALFKAFLRSQK